MRLHRVYEQRTPWRAHALALAAARGLLTAAGGLGYAWMLHALLTLPLPR